MCQLSDNRAIRNLGIASMVAGTGVGIAKKLANANMKQLSENDYYVNIFDKNGLNPENTKNWVGWNYPYPNGTPYYLSTTDGGRGWNCGNFVYKQMLILTSNKIGY